MKPVAIFRHSSGEGPGYFATFLDAHSVPWLLIKVDQGEPVPSDPSAFSGLAFMGGPMSVNDPLPWVEQGKAKMTMDKINEGAYCGICHGKVALPEPPPMRPPSA